MSKVNEVSMAHGVVVAWQLSILGQWDTWENLGQPAGSLRRMKGAFLNLSKMRAVGFIVSDVRECYKNVYVEFT